MSNGRIDTQDTESGEIWAVKSKFYDDLKTPFPYRTIDPKVQLLSPLEKYPYRSIELGMDEDKKAEKGLDDESPKSCFSIGRSSDKANKTHRNESENSFFFNDIAISATHLEGYVFPCSEERVEYKTNSLKPEYDICLRDVSQHGTMILRHGERVATTIPEEQYVSIKSGDIIGLVILGSCTDWSDTGYGDNIFKDTKLQFQVITDYTSCLMLVRLNTKLYEQIFNLIEFGTDDMLAKPGTERISRDLNWYLPYVLDLQVSGVDKENFGGDSYSVAYDQMIDIALFNKDSGFNELMRKKENLTKAYSYDNIEFLTRAYDVEDDSDDEEYTPTNFSEDELPIEDDDSGEEHANNLPNNNESEDDWEEEEDHEDHEDAEDEDIFSGKDFSGGIKSCDAKASLVTDETITKSNIDSELGSEDDECIDHDSNNDQDDWSDDSMNEDDLDEAKYSSTYWGYQDHGYQPKYGYDDYDGDCCEADSILGMCTDSDNDSDGADSDCDSPIEEEDPVIVVVVDDDDDDDDDDYDYDHDEEEDEDGDEDADAVILEHAVLADTSKEDSIFEDHDNEPSSSNSSTTSAAGKDSEQAISSDVFSVCEDSGSEPEEDIIIKKVMCTGNKRKIDEFDDDTVRVTKISKPNSECFTSSKTDCALDSEGSEPKKAFDGTPTAAPPSSKLFFAGFAIGSIVTMSALGVAGAFLEQ